MRNQSKVPCPGEFAHIEVDPDFPVAVPDFNTRGEHPRVNMHIHDLFEIGYCFDGTGVFLIGGKIFEFAGGDAVVINTREFHLAKANPGGTASWGFLNLDPVALLPPEQRNSKAALALPRCCGEKFCNLISGNSESELAECIRQLILERRDLKPDYRSMIRALNWQMLILLNRYREIDHLQTTPGDYRDIDRIAPALSFMSENLHREITVPELARRCFTSVPNFRRLFLRATGCAPQPYLLQMRLKIAAAMLKNRDTPISAIAMQCGYKTLSNFNRQFHREFGIPPREYRNNAAVFLPADSPVP